MNPKKINFAVPNLQILWDSTEIYCSQPVIINDLIKLTADMSDPLDSFILIIDKKLLNQRKENII